MAKPHVGSRHVRIACAALAVLVASCAGRHATTATAPAVTAQILGAGSVITEHEGDRLPAPDTGEGSIGQVPTYWTPKFLAPPDQVRARLGLSLGIEVRIERPESSPRCSYARESPIRRSCTPARAAAP
ncbi:MAG TPA: hypothetical protein VGS57_21015 [Thermoanaerobaculia bacterium]|jgi:hypothetical protein|nr:hypothetical protein [Thermoanaerobaculia bacterium]